MPGILWQAAADVTTVSATVTTSVGAVAAITAATDAHTSVIPNALVRWGSLLLFVTSLMAGNGTNGSNESNYVTSVPGSGLNSRKNKNAKGVSEARLYNRWS